MSGITGFLAVHLALVAIVPRSLGPMVTGRNPDHETEVGLP
jgi:hypothetical protein